LIYKQLQLVLIHQPACSSTLPEHKGQQLTTMWRSVDDLRR
jgi:hypothetical protein